MWTSSTRSTRVIQKFWRALPTLSMFPCSNSPYLYFPYPATFLILYYAATLQPRLILTTREAISLYVVCPKPSNLKRYSVTTLFWCAPTPRVGLKLLYAPSAQMTRTDLHPRYQCILPKPLEPSPWTFPTWPRTNLSLPPFVYWDFISARRWKLLCLVMWQRLRRASWTLLGVSLTPTFPSMILRLPAALRNLFRPWGRACRMPRLLSLHVLTRWYANKWLVNFFLTADSMMCPLRSTRRPCSLALFAAACSFATWV